MLNPNTVTQNNAFVAAPHADGLRITLHLVSPRSTIPRSRENRFDFWMPLRMRKKPLIVRRHSPSSARILVTHRRSMMPPAGGGPALGMRCSGQSVALAAARHVAEMPAERRGKIRRVGVAHGIRRLGDRQSLMQQGFAGGFQPAGPQIFRCADAIDPMKLRRERHDG